MEIRKRMVSILVVVAMFAGMFSAIPVNVVSAASGPFVMAYHTTGTSGTNMSYMDDSLHLAYSSDGINWTALNDNNGILFKKNTSGGVDANIEFRNPFLFKKQDGTYVLLATTTSNTGATASSNICAWDSTDLLTYTNERVITTNTFAQVPQCKYDSASGNYVVFWTDGTNNYSAITTDFTSALTGTQYTGTEYPVTVSAALAPSLKATPGSVITVTQTELDNLINAIGTPVIPTGTKDINVSTSINTPPVLPDVADVQNSDGTTVQKSGITWDAVDPAKLTKEGTFTVNGHINGTQDYINPLIKNGADPDIYKGPDGYYYYTSSYMDYIHSGVSQYQYDRITLRRASTIQGLATATEKTIFTKYASGDASAHIWAPEIHYINGKWYVYFAGGKSNAAFDLRAYVLECSGDPMVDTWGTPAGATGVAAGGPAKIAMSNEQFDLDATVFEFDGSMYMAWAYKYNSVPSSIRLAKMVNPYTLDSNQVTISTPEYTWERRFDKVMEAPTVLIKNGKIFMGYSAGSTDSTYAMGLLTASAASGTNLLDPASWIKTPYPVMATSAENGQYGPGHYTFTVGEKGQDVVSYHARENQKYSGVNNYDPLYDSSRWARVQNLYWHKNDTPYFGIPAKDGYLPGAGVKATVKVNAAAGTIFLNESSFDLRVNNTHNVILKKGNGDGSYVDLTSAAVITSSDPSIAKVDAAGSVTGVKEGNCSISLVYGGQTYTVNVNVFKSTAAPDLVLQYKFDEGSGTTAKDSSGNNNDGTLSGSGAAWATDSANNGAIALSGGSVRIPDHIFSGLKSMTVSANVYFDSSNAVPFWLCSFSSDAAAVAGTRYFGMLEGWDGQFRASISTNWYESEQTVSKGSALARGVWKNVAYTINSDGTAILYENGVKIAQKTDCTILPEYLENTIANYIGKAPFPGDKYFMGKVSDFRIYKHALSADEVKGVWVDSLSDTDAVAFVKGKLDLGDVSAVISNLNLPTAYEDASISWDSDNKAVIANNGTVTRTSTDTTVNLTATITRGSVSDTKIFAVKVLKSGTVYSLDSSSYSVYPNETHNTVLTATLEDLSTQNVTSGATFSSSDATIAAVDATGVVTGIKPGTAVISVKYNGNTYNANVTVEQDMVLRYKLDETNGTTAIDSSGNGKDGILKGGASWLGGDGISLDGSSGYIQMPNGILSGLSNITISANLYVDPANADPTWLCSFSSAYPAVDGTKYLGILEATNNYKFRASITDNAWHNEQTASKDSSLAKGIWKNIVYTLASDGTGTLYEDGVKVGQNVGGTLLPKDIEATVANYIGKAPYSGDKYLKAKIKDFRLYKRVLNNTEIKIISSANDTDSVAKDQASLTLGDTSAVQSNMKLPVVAEFGSTVTWASSDANVISPTGLVTRPAADQADATVTLTATITRGTVSATKTFTVNVIKQNADIVKVKEDAETLVVHNINDVRGNLTLPTKGLNGSNITWKSENTNLITSTGVVSRPANDSNDTTVRLTATISLNSTSITKAFNAVVKKLPVKEDPKAYLFAYFIGEDTANGEQMYFALSNGNDPLNWSNMNGGNPVFTSKLGTKGLRDPSIVRSPDGDKFYMIATDLKIYGNGDWTAAQKTGSTSIMVWESTDLVHWSNQRMVKVNTDLAGCTWAPEAFYDKTTGEYVVYWASKVYSDATKSGSPNQRIMYAKTRDFYTFTDPKELYNPGYSVIDSTSIEYNGKVYRFTKDERDRNESQYGKLVFEEVSDTFFGNFTTVTKGIGTSIDPGNDKVAVEGPAIFKANGENKWYLFVDWFSGGGYKALYTTDLGKGDWTYAAANMPLPAPRHGTVIPITQTEYSALSANVPVEISPSTVEASQVVLDKTNVSLNNGGQEALTAIVGPDAAADKTVLWSSNNEAVATVDDSGMVTAVATGSAIVTATTVSGSHIATCSVNVSDAQKGSVEGVVLDGANPVDGALVNIAAQGGIYSTTTSSGGIFVLSGIPEGTGYTVTADKAGYSQGSAIVDVAANTTTSAIVIKISKNSPSPEYVPPVSGLPGNSSTTQTTEEKVTSSITGGKVIVTIKSEAPVNADGTAKAVITEAQIDAAIKKAAQEKANVTGSTAIEINVQAHNAAALSASIPQAAVESALKSGISALNIVSPVVNITFDKPALDTINKNANGNIIVNAVPKNELGLSEQDSDNIGDRPIYSLSVTTGTETIRNLGDGKALISIPYVAKAGENPDNIIVYALNSAGKLVKVTHCEYDESTASMKFISNNLSVFALGASVSDFSDISGWYADAVNYLSARGVINGKGNGQFAPDANITRAEFVTILAKLAGVDLSNYKASAFSDINKNSWFNGSVQWAYENGIVSGYDGKFSPNSRITRQDMAVIIAKFTDKIEKQSLSKAKPAVDFSDDARISSYAKEAVTQLQQAGIISGKGNNTFAPKSNATRAEAASMVTVLLKGVIK